MALIPPFFLDTVVAIGVGDDPSQRKWIGTGFLYGLLSDNKDGEKGYLTFLLSNKHVLDGNQEIWIKLNASDASGSKDYKIPLVFKNGRPTWVGHTDAAVDIGAIVINANALKQENRKFGLFHSDEHVLVPADLKSLGVSEGDGVFALGFPMGMVDISTQYVICRSGAISRIRDMLDGKNNSFLVDAPVFPGNSGGPVILRPEIIAIEGTKAINKASLVGIVCSYVPYRDTAVSTQTGKPRIVFEENSGLSSIHHVGLIQEVVDIAKKRLLSRSSYFRRKASEK